MKKRIFAIAMIAVLAMSMMTACGSKTETADGTTLKCLADTTPHKEILDHAAEALAAEGITLDVVSETWDETWNEQVQNGDVDFNYDAYQPYLDEWNEANNGTLIGATAAGSDNAGIHVEPLVMMSEKYDSVDALPDNAVIAVKNDATNEYRCLKVLEAAGLVKLSDELTMFNASTDMVAEYVKPIKIVEMDADVIMQDKQDFDAYLTNTNRLLDAGMDPTKYLAREEATGSEFANVIAVREDRLEDENIQKLVEVLQSDEMRDWINDNYAGAVVAAF